MQCRYLFSCALFFSTIFFSSSHAGSLTYSALTDNVKTDTQWQKESKDGKFTLIGNSSVKNVTLECSSSFELEKFSQKEISNGKEFFVSRKNGVLEVITRTNGKEKTKKYDIGNTPWVQEFKFCFPPFLASNKKEYKFYIVNPKDLDLHGMVATKEALETIEVQGKSYKAQKVKITLQGFKKKFWKAEVWFDPQSHILLKYKANEGPGTAFTETTLASPLDSVRSEF